MAFAAHIGLDWADKKHDYCLKTVESETLEYGTFRHHPADINTWALSLQSRFAEQKVAICLELKSGPIVAALQKFPFITLFFVTPFGLAKYRQAFTPSGAKDDPKDAFLQLDYLLKHRSKLREVKPDTVCTRIIAQLVEHRKCFVNEKVKQTNRIRASLKNYYPLVLDIFRDIDTKVFCDFVTRWPTLAELKKARTTTLEEFFRVHCSPKSRIKDRIALIKQATPLTNDEAIIEVNQQYMLTMVAQLKLTLKAISDYQKRIDKQLEAHPDKDIFKSLPAAGPVLAPQILTAFGTDRDKFSNAQQVGEYTGIAPVLKQSGKKSTVHRRYQCARFIHQTFVDWAGQTVRYSFWAKSFYDKKRSEGMAHHCVLRALAFKWIRIIFRCWQNHTKYNESTYLLAKQKREIQPS